MSAELTCGQINGLLAFYIDDKLTENLKELVKKHLNICPACREKFEALKSMILSLRDAYATISAVGAEKKQQVYETKQYQEFQTNLSAYVDNELSDVDNLKIKRYAISNPLARNDLDNMYRLEKILANSFSKTKRSFRRDYSKDVIRDLNLNEEIYSNDAFFKVASVFILIFVASVAFAIALFSL